MGTLRQLKVGENSFSDFSPKFTSENSRKTAKKNISNHAIPTSVELKILCDYIHYRVKFHENRTSTSQKKLVHFTLP